jgi:hypothetical protein
MNCFAINGQSLSLGAMSGSIMEPILSSVPSLTHKMFVDGVRPQVDYPAHGYEVSYASLSALVEQLCPSNNAIGETPCYGAAQMISQLIAAENPAAAAYRMHMTSPGQGGVDIAALSPGTVSYARLLQQVQYGQLLAGQAGWSYAAQAMAWIQGENDYTEGTTRATYNSKLQALATAWRANAGICALQAFGPITLVAQIASHLYAPTPTPSIALAQTDAATALPAFLRMACAMYQFEYVPGMEWHLNNSSSKWLGAYLGLAYKRLVYDGSASWAALSPQSCTRSGSTITLTFNPVGQLVFDRSWVTAIANEGFQAYQADGTTPLTINSVSISGTNAVNIVCSTSIPANAVVNYAWQGTVGQTGPGRVTGARGTLRDSQGDSIVFDPSGINMPMHNWCLIFSKTVTN